MIWEYLILAAILGWAIYYLGRAFFRRQGGCSCGSACGAAGKAGCEEGKKDEQCGDRDPEKPGPRP